MKVKVLTGNFVGGKRGDIVVVDENTVNVRALIKAGTVAAVPDPPKKKKAAAPAKDDD